MSTLRLAAGLGVLLATGCAVGPDYHRPDLNLPGSYRAAPATSARSIADVGWWEVFGDAQLVNLIEEALRDNLDLAIAAAQILEAEANLEAARAPLFPQAAGQVQANRGNETPPYTTTNTFIAALALSWEIDFWGRYRRATEAARASLRATEDGRRAIISSLVANVALQYLQLTSLRQSLAIVQRTAAAQRDSLRLVTLLARQGVQSAAEVAQAKSQLLSTESQIPGLDRQISQSEDALAILLGKPPRAFATATALPVFPAAPQIPAGIPSELLERRPDVRQSEQQLIAANANIGVAKAQFFPSLSLTGSLGRVSDTLHGLTQGGGEQHALAVTVNQPIFQGGALLANYRAAEALAQQALLSYRRTILIALQQVADDLVAYDRYGVEAETNRQLVESAKESLRLVQLRFRSGVDAYVDVLVAQQTLLSAELNLNASETNQRVSVIQLYQALGGGWTPQKNNQTITQGN
jgi:outer membrane protein, multidrug efflux system